MEAKIDRHVERNYEPRYHTSTRHYPRNSNSNSSTLAADRDQDLQQTPALRFNTEHEHIETAAHKPRESDQPQREPPLRTLQTRYNSSFAEKEPGRRIDKEESLDYIPASRTLKQQDERPHSRARQHEAEPTVHKNYLDHERERKYLRERERAKPQEADTYSRERDYVPSRERRERRDRTNRPKIEYVAAV